MSSQSGSATWSPPRKSLLASIVWLSVVVVSASIYANLAFAVTHPTTFRYFPPFEAGVNANANRHLGHEYFNIARSLAAGKGFTDPFPVPTGPTAWMPPALPALLAAILWICDGNHHAVLVIVIILKSCVLIGTGLLVVLVTRQTSTHVGAAVAACVFLVLLLAQFRQAFQYANDGWLVMLAIDLLLAGFLWSDHIRSWRTAAAWGLFGGVCALVNPIAAFVWGGVSLIAYCRARAWSRLAVTLLAAGLTVAPWMIRNYLVLGRWLPVKSNLAYELYQSQCLQPDGVLQARTFGLHPNITGSREQREFLALREIGYLDLKRKQFSDAVAANPIDFLERVAARFLAATLWYVPFQRAQEASHPWMLWFHRLTHPWPFVGFLVIVLGSVAWPWSRVQWCVVAVYCLYLLPYIAVSYYERYAFPLLAVQTLLVIWAVDRVLSFWRGETSS